MVRQRKRGTAERTPLSRDHVVRAAVGIADRDGIQALSMRRLGEEVGVEAMSLYNHVRNKEEVLDGMIDDVFSQIELTTNGVEWRTAMRGRAVSARQALLRHPWAIGLMESRSRAGSNTLRHHDGVLGILRRSGFSVDAAGHAYSILDSYTYGFTLNELSLPFDSSRGAAEVGASLISGMHAAYPHLAEMLIEVASKPGYSYSNEFEFGLDLILEGLERLRAST